MPAREIPPATVCCRGPSSAGASIRPSKRPPASGRPRSSRRRRPAGQAAGRSASPLSATPQLRCRARCASRTLPSRERGGQLVPAPLQHRRGDGARSRSPARAVGRDAQHHVAKGQHRLRRSQRRAARAHGSRRLPAPPVRPRPRRRSPGRPPARARDNAPANAAGRRLQLHPGAVRVRVGMDDADEVGRIRPGQLAGDLDRDALAGACRRCARDSRPVGPCQMLFNFSSETISRLLVIRPPSTGRTAPMIKEASSEAKSTPHGRRPPARRCGRAVTIRVSVPLVLATSGTTCAWERVPLPPRLWKPRAKPTICSRKS